MIAIEKYIFQSHYFGPLWFHVMLLILAGLWHTCRRAWCPVVWWSEAESSHRQGTGQKPTHPATGRSYVCSGQREWEGCPASFRQGTIIHGLLDTCDIYQSWLFKLLLPSINSNSCIENHCHMITISLYSMSIKKRKPGLTPNFSKPKKDFNKLISVHDSIIILLSFGTLFIHIWPWMAAQQSLL